jgi:hypothetical protein
VGDIGPVKSYFPMAIERDKVMRSGGEKGKYKEIELGMQQEKAERRTFLGARGSH